MEPTPRFSEALVYASVLHARQRRKRSEVPFLAHLLSVASIVMEQGGSEVEAIAALLHDAVEDQGGAPRWADIRARFGDEVAEIVAACTDSMELPEQPKQPWRERKDAYLAHLPTASRSVQLVTAADKLHNVRSLVEDYLLCGEELWQRFNGGREGTLWYYREVLQRLDQLHGTPLLAQLDRAVAQLEELAANPSPESGEAL